MRVRLIVLLTLVGLLTTACGAVGGSMPSLVGTQWILVSLDGEAPIVGTSLTARFDDRGTVAGSSGCNAYSAPYQVSGSDLTIGSAAGTLMACEPDVMAQESAFLAALGATASYRIAGGRLALADPSGEERLVFEGQSQTLEGTSWTVISYNNGKQAVVSVLGGTEITANFGPDGQLAGNAGCNEYQASYQASASTIEIGPPAATRMFCGEPEGVMDQETQYLLALQTAATYSIEGEAMEFRAADGGLAVSFRSADN